MPAEPVVLRLTRDVTRDECDWLDRDFREGQLIQQCFKPDYGSVGPRGINCSIQEDGGYPAFELPIDAVERVSR